MKQMVVMAVLFLFAATGVAMAAGRIVDQRIGLSHSKPLSRQDLVPDKPLKNKTKQKARSKAKKSKNRPDRKIPSAADRQVAPASEKPDAPAEAPANNQKQYGGSESAEPRQEQAKQREHESEESDETEKGEEDYDD